MARPTFSSAGCPVRPRQRWRRHRSPPWPSCARTSRPGRGRRGRTAATAGPAGREDERPNEHGEGDAERPPDVEDEAVGVGDGRVADEHRRAAPGHVVRDAGQPPRHPAARGEELGRVLHPAAGPPADPQHDEEADDDHAPVESTHRFTPDSATSAALRSPAVGRRQHGRASRLSSRQSALSAPRAPCCAGCWRGPATDAARARPGPGRHRGPAGS
jgi:hypothetical protein